MLETVLLSIYNHDSAIASAASRMTLAAGDRPCIEMGSRRTHEEAAVAAARAAYVAGFATTLQPRRPAAVRRPDAPGTSAHCSRCCTTPRRTRSARRSTRSARGTTLLVDTYDVAEAVRLGVEVAGPELGAVRHRLRRPRACSPTQVRAQLDSLGATGTRIVVTSDLDEHAIAALAAAPVDGYGVGTQLVTGSGHPTCGFVYKLVAREDDDGVLVSRWPRRASTRSRSAAASTRCAGATPDGVAEAEVIGIGTPPENDGDDRELLVAARARRRGGRPRAARRRPRPARRRPRRAAARGPADVPGEPVIPTVFEGDQ